MRGFIWCFGIVLGLVACRGDRLYEEFMNMDGIWYQDSSYVFTFEVMDTSLSYNLVFHLTNDAIYPYYNLYFNHQLLDAEDSVVDQQLNELILFDPKTGKPNGSGIGSSFSHSILLLENYSFTQTGRYSVGLNQFMRQEQLSDIERIGLRVEKYTKD